MTENDSFSGQLLGHEYDGIQEYDNPVPGWWHIIFLLSVLFAPLYVMVYHMNVYMDDIYESYDASVAAYYRAQFAKFGELVADEETIAGLAANENYMSAVRGTYIGKCASCHGKDGQGLVGPNMTDEAYLHVKTLPDIYKTINEGVVLKGMPAWGRQLHQSELVLLTAYVSTLRGNDVAGGKSPEGEVIPSFPIVEPLVFEDESTESSSSEQ